MIGSLRSVLAAILVFSALGAAAAEPRPPVRAVKHMVVTANPYASEAGLRTLRAGGSAIDAAIAAQLVLSLVEPQSSGIGGGAFLMHYDKADGKRTQPALTAYEGRETAPKAAHPAMFLDENGAPKPFFAVAVGGLPVGAPGVLRMLEMAHKDHGRLPWADLFPPVIELAEGGFEVSPRLHFLLDRFKSFARGAAFRAAYYDERGEARPAGYRLVNKDYAATLRLLAKDGAEPMYKGALASEIVAATADPAFNPGFLTLADLEAYRARKSAPLCAPYREWRVCGPKPPTSGGVGVLQILGILENFDLAALKQDQVAAIHTVAEAMRLAYADRDRYLADDDFVSPPVDGLLKPSYLKSRAALIDPKKALPEVAAGVPPSAVGWNFAPASLQEGVSTSHLVIADRWGDAISMTTSVQGPFGSQVMVGGFILNNQLTDFSFVPARNGQPVANRAEGGKRPLSSMSPILVTDAKGRLKLAIGSPGGTKIIAYVAQSLIEFLDWRRTAQEAVAAPHFLAQVSDVELEAGSPLSVLAPGLQALGHPVALREHDSGLHAIAFDYEGKGRVLSGGVDPRREGRALGD